MSEFWQGFLTAAVALPLAWIVVSESARASRSLNATTIHCLWCPFQTSGWFGPVFGLHTRVHHADAVRTYRRLVDAGIHHAKAQRQAAAEHPDQNNRSGRKPYRAGRAGICDYCQRPYRAWAMLRGGEHLGCYTPAWVDRALEDLCSVPGVTARASVCGNRVHVSVPAERLEDARTILGQWAEWSDDEAGMPALIPIEPTPHTV